MVFEVSLVVDLLSWSPSDEKQTGNNTKIVRIHWSPVWCCSDKLKEVIIKEKIYTKQKDNVSKFSSTYLKSTYILINRLLTS